MRRLLFVALIAGTAAHMPAGAGSGTRDAPVDLGDPTENSWALTGTMEPNQVLHYKFSINGPTTTASPNTHKFYMGLYVPGAGEPDFTFYVAVFGMANTTMCKRWGDGWGRRRQLSGGSGHSHSHDHDSHSHGVSPYRITSAGTTWLMDSSTIPERVIGHHDGHAHKHEGFDYHKPEETLVFIASPTTDLPNKFESFSPTLFKPRGSCIADFMHGGEYRIAVWGDASQAAPKKFSVGIGLAERDVFAPVNLMLFDYTLFDIQTWNGWSGIVLVLPIIIFVVVAVLLLAIISKRAPNYYGTTSGWATPFRALTLISSAIILGHLCMNIAIFAWAASNAHIEQARELVFPLVLGIALPLVSGSLTLLIGLRLPICGCCARKTSAAGCCYRITVGIFGVVQLFLHCGYIVGPVLMIVASILPPAIANKGLATGGGEVIAAKGKAAGPKVVSAVQSTPSQASAVSPAGVEIHSPLPSPPSASRSNSCTGTQPPYIV